MATFIGEIVAMPTTRKAIKDKEGSVIGHEMVNRITLEPRETDSKALIDHLFEIMGEAVQVTIVLEQGQLPK